MIDEYVKQWLFKADNDLKVAESILKSPPADVVTEAVCFHAQQAVEKYLKAFLVVKQIDFGKTHNLEYLLELCVKSEVDFRGVRIGHLTSYAVEVRYPDEFYTPTLAEAGESVVIAQRIKDFISKIIC